MRSIKFPNMLNSSTTAVWQADEYLESTKQNVCLLLNTERGEITCDPGFGVKLKQYLFDQNDRKLKDVIIDTIYTQLAMFIPQLWVKRSDIEIIQDREKGKLYCRFSATNQISYEVNTYNLVLFNSADQQ